MANKNIVVFIDGTSNAGKPGSPKNTNVYKLYCAADAASKEGEQCCLYIEGVGTWGAFTRLAGGAAGLGVSRRVRLGYRHLVKNYNEGDRIYLFGFSRGAFAVRSLAGFVDHVGVLLANHIGKVRKAFRIYQRDQSVDKSALRQYVKKIRPDYDTREKRPLKVYFIGVWDTVGRLGIPVVNRLLPARFVKFHKTDLPPNVTHARQALALHELRRIFDPEVWTHFEPPQSLKQTWFVGAHSDVGGGYREHGLSDLALCWMAAEAKKEHLLIDESELTVAPNYLQPVHHEIKKLFRFSRPTCRPMLGKHPKPHETTFVHDSVIARYLSSSPTAHPGRRRIRERLRSIDGQAQRFSLWLASVVGNKPDNCVAPCPAHGRPVRICCVANGDWWDTLNPEDLAHSKQLVHSILVDGDSSSQGGAAVPLARALCVLFVLGQDQRLEAALQSFHETRKNALVQIQGLRTPDELDAYGSVLARIRWIDLEIQGAKALLRPDAQQTFVTLVGRFHDNDSDVPALVSAFKLREVKVRMPPGDFGRL